MTVEPALTIIIVSHNARADLERCLTSLADAPPKVTHHTVVVDNASSDGSAEAVRTGWPRVTVLEPGRNLGFAAANNLAIRSTTGELLLLLNGDTLVPAGAIDGLVHELERRPEVGIVGPRLIDSAGHAELSTGAMIGPWHELHQSVIGRLHAAGFSPVYRWVERRARRLHYPDWVSGACLLVSRADAEAVGLLDERYFLYNEDVDFCAAVRQQGRRVLFAPSVEVVHLRGHSVASAPEATARTYRGSQVAFYAKHHPRMVGLLRLYLRLTGRPVV